jgi:hypothetical protein
MGQIKFNPRWREELVAASDEGVLILEIAMGTLHVYFPDEAKWLASAPGWAREKWQIYLDACAIWCKENRIPISIVNNTFMYEEKSGT